MKTTSSVFRRITTLGLLLGLCTGSVSARDYWNETAAQRDARMKWWREARFGLFIHWGLYAIPAGEWNGQTNHAEWIRHTAKIPRDEYSQFTNLFNPVKFNAAEWARLTRRAGMKYLVITSKHHDGFCLWDSQLTDFDVAGTPFRRAILGELSRACRKENIRFATYHSIMDWHHPDYLPRRSWEQADRPATGADFARFRQYLKGQLAELVRGYNPAVMWFDGEWEDTWTHEMGVDLYDYVRGLDPRIIINNRVDKGRRGMQGLTSEGNFRGDFGTPEQEIPPRGLPGVDWESCMTMNRYWGCNRFDTQWKSTEDLVRKLVDIVSKGGNFLLNVGPKPDGTFPAEAIERLEGMGEWMKGNSDAIYGTQASPFTRLPWGRCTQKPTRRGSTLFLHVFDWPADGRLIVPGLLNTPAKAYLLVDAKQKSLPAQREGSGLVISVPTRAPDAISSTVVVELKDALQVEPVILSQNADGSLTLPASEAHVHGDGLRHETGHGKDNLGYWTNPADWAEWEFVVNRPGQFQVTAEIAALQASQLELRAGNQTVRAATPATGDYVRFQPVTLGTLTLATAGPQTLSLRAVKDGWQPVNVRLLRLIPAP